MEINEYSELSQRTIPENRSDHFEHGIIGVCTEAGELADIIKRNLYYGTAIDIANLKEEIGDIMWYLNIIVVSKNLSWGEILEGNVNKLAKRYPQKFDEHYARTRLDKLKSMNIFSKVGCKLIYLGRGGYDNDRAYIESYGIKPGDIVKLAWSEISRNNTIIMVHEVPGKSFNSVCFANYGEFEEDEKIKSAWY